MVDTLMSDKWHPAFGSIANEIKLKKTTNDTIARSLTFKYDTYVTCKIKCVRLVCEVSKYLSAVKHLLHVSLV